MIWIIRDLYSNRKLNQMISETSRSWEEERTSSSVGRGLLSTAKGRLRTWIFWTFILSSLDSSPNKIVDLLKARTFQNLRPARIQERKT